MAKIIIGNFLYKLTDKFRAFGSGTDKAHFTPENIQDLRQFINMSQPQKPPNGSHAGILFFRPLWALFFGVQDHLRECGPCLRLMGIERSFKSVVSERYSPAVAPAGLRERIHDALSSASSNDRAKDCVEEDCAETQPSQTERRWGWWAVCQQGASMCIVPTY